MKRFSSTIKRKILDPITIEYKDLIRKDINFRREIEIAYGGDGAGLLMVRNIPGYSELRKNLLPLARKVHYLPPEIKQKYERPEINNLIGIAGSKCSNGVCSTTWQPPTTPTCWNRITSLSITTSTEKRSK